MRVQRLSSLSINFPRYHFSVVISKRTWKREKSPKSRFRDFAIQTSRVAHHSAPAVNTHARARIVSAEYAPSDMISANSTPLEPFLKTR